VSAEMRDLGQAACAFAREAGAILLEGHGRVHAPEKKGRIDLVTEFDRRSEALLVSRIRERFPDHAILAEESGAGGASRARVRWICDPLDGTTNYAHNYPFFCVSVGVEVDGVMAAGAVYDPVREELFAAAVGRGATLNGAPIHVSAVVEVESALLVTGFPYDVREHPARPGASSPATRTSRSASRAGASSPRTRRSTPSCSPWSRCTRKQAPRSPIAGLERAPRGSPCRHGQRHVEDSDAVTAFVGDVDTPVL